MADLKVGKMEVRWAAGTAVLLGSQRAEWSVERLVEQLGTHLVALKVASLVAQWVEKRGMTVVVQMVDLMAAKMEKLLAVC